MWHERADNAIPKEAKQSAIYLISSLELVARKTRTAVKEVHIRQVVVGIDI